MSILKDEDYNLLWSQLIIEELYRLGVRNFCLSPGHRSTTLALSLAKIAQVNKDICFNTFIDERAAAFYALGYSKVKHIPSVLICTSGSAVANYFPAIIEAYYSGVPLLVLSADRPPELKDSSANQAIDQIKLFGNYSYYIEIPTPTKEIHTSYILGTIDFAFNKAIVSQGVVHINCMFREPFINKYNNYLELCQKELPQKWFESNKPYSVHIKNTINLNIDVIEDVVQIISNTQKGIIIIGNIDNNVLDTQAIRYLLDFLHWPVYADVLSGFKNQHYTIPFLDFFCEDIVDTLDTIIFIGDRVVSKKIYSLLDKTNASQIKIIDRCIHSDPTHSNNFILVGSINHICEDLVRSLTQHYVKESYFFNSLLEMSSKLLKSLQYYIEQENDILYSAIAISYITNHIPKNYGIFSANSMSIRLLNDFMFSSFLVACNRGASGIDGNLATAIGYANSIQVPTILFIGDLAFLHDLNSLYLLNKSPIPLLLILLNDNGGGIFSMLPFSKESSYNDVFESSFILPHNTNFSNIISSFNIQYFEVKTIELLKKSLDLALEMISLKKSAVIDIQLNSSLNKEYVSNLYQYIINEKNKIRS